MKIAVFYAHILDAVKQENKELKEILTEVKQMGYEGLECDYNDFKDGVSDFYKSISACGLEVSGVYRFLDFNHIIDETDLEQFVQDVSAVKSKKILAIPGFITDENKREEDTQKMCEGLNTLCDIAERYGITVTLEDFDDIKSPCCTPEGLRNFMDNVPKLKYTFDTGNFYYCDVNELDALELLKNRLYHVHLKDRILNIINLGEEAKPTVTGKIMYPTPVGMGVIDIKECIKRAKSLGYNDYFTVEHFGSAKQMEFMKKSIDFIRENYG